MTTYILKPNGVRKDVKNLGWILRNASWVEKITLSDRDDGARCGCKFFAEMSDGTEYHTSFNSLSIAREFVKKRVFRDVPFKNDFVRMLSASNP